MKLIKTYILIFYYFIFTDRLNQLTPLTKRIFKNDTTRKVYLKLTKMILEYDRDEPLTTELILNDGVVVYIYKKIHKNGMESIRFTLNKNDNI